MKITNVKYFILYFTQRGFFHEQQFMFSNFSQTSLSMWTANENKCCTYSYVFEKKEKISIFLLTRGAKKEKKNSTFFIH